MTFSSESDRKSQYASTLTRLIANMKPVVALPERQENSDLFLLEAPPQPGLSNLYLSSLLPPEYDPYRSYPAIVCLHAGGMTPAQKSSGGPVRRHLADEWDSYTARLYRHCAEITSTLARTVIRHRHLSMIKSRDACDTCRRFNIDSDRVYLSGHSMEWKRFAGILDFRIPIFGRCHPPSMRSRTPSTLTRTSAMLLRCRFIL